VNARRFPDAHKMPDHAGSASLALPVRAQAVVVSGAAVHISAIRPLSAGNARSRAGSGVNPKTETASEAVGEIFFSERDGMGATARACPYFQQVPQRCDGGCSPAFRKMPGSGCERSAIGGCCWTKRGRWKASAAARWIIGALRLGHFLIQHVTCGNSQRRNHVDTSFQQIRNDVASVQNNVQQHGTLGTEHLQR
jgi:hypothetical protein